VTADNKVRIK